MTDDALKAFGAIAGIAACLGIGALAITIDREERALIKGGHCTKVMEALYTPPPSAHSSCHGDGASRYCSTRYSQRDPYLRSLWRCVDPEDGRAHEFWRRTSEEFGK